LLIVGAAISGSSRGGETLDMRMLDINNQNCIKKKNRAYLGKGSFRRSLVRSKMLSSTNLKLKRQI